MSQAEGRLPGLKITKGCRQNKQEIWNSFLKTPKEHRENVGHHEKTQTLSNRSDDGEYEVKGKDLKFQKWLEKKRTVVIQEAEPKTDR